MSTSSSQAKLLGLIKCQVQVPERLLVVKQQPVVESSPVWHQFWTDKPYPAFFNWIQSTAASAAADGRFASLIVRLAIRTCALDVGTPHWNLVHHTGAR